MGRPQLHATVFLSHRYGALMFGCKRLRRYWCPAGSIGQFQLVKGQQAVACTQRGSLCEGGVFRAQ